MIGNFEAMYSPELTERNQFRLCEKLDQSTKVRFELSTSITVLVPNNEVSYFRDF